MGDATYIPPDPSFARHTVCSADPWFFPLTLADTPSASARHPNEAGQRELEQERCGYDAVMMWMVSGRTPSCFIASAASGVASAC